MQALQTTLFDYATLDTETRIVVQQRTTEIKALMKRAASDIIEIGQKLIEVKARLGHGHFGGWLAAEFDWTDRTAQRFIGVAEHFKSDNLSDLQIAPSALYLLAAPSTPDSARDEALTRAEEGETITHGLARDIVSNHRNPPIPFDPDDEPLSPYEQGIADRYINHNDPIAIDDDDRTGRQKPKINRAGDIDEPKGFDVCQTPPEAIDPLLRYIREGAVVWEPAAGECHLVDAFYDAGHDVIQSDIQTGQNFFSFDPDGWDVLVTNPPYSIKYQWLERCYQLGKPFALLLPVETLGAQKAQALFAKHGVQIILLDRRINFKMPNIGWEGSSAQFPVAWFTWGLNLETQIVFGKLP